MGLMLARIDSSFDSGVSRTVTATVTGGAVATGIVSTGQYAYGEDSRPQTKPTEMNHVVGIGGGIAGAIVGAFGGWTGAEGSSTGRKFGFGGLGVAIGSLAGAYLVAPTIRRMRAD